MYKTMLNLILVAGMMLSGLSQSAAKTNVRSGEYVLGQVTGNNINIRRGPGTEFPKAYSVYTDYDGRQARSEVAPAYKGQRLFVKDAGDWWEIETPSVANGDSPRYISKKFLNVVETDPFDTVTEPQVWGEAKREMGYEGDMMDVVNVVTIYPGGIVVTQYDGSYERGVTIGVLNEDRTAVMNLVNLWIMDSGNEVPANTPLSMSLQAETLPPSIIVEYGRNCKKTFTCKGRKGEYIDISGVPEEQWIEIVKEVQKSENYPNIRTSPTDPEIYRVRGDLSGYVRIK